MTKNIMSEFKFEQDINPASTKPQLIQAMSIKTGNFVAIKFFSKEIVSKLKEEEIMRTIAMFNSLRHKYLIHYHEVHRDGIAAYLVMDWCEGKSLYDTLQGYRNLPEKLVSRYIYEVLQGLEYLHSQGTTHNNIKATNILTTNGMAKLTDFGLSAKISNLDILEHPYWSAPEVLNAKNYSRESDIWSLACTILELMTGKPPWADLSPYDARAHILNDEIPQFPDSFSEHLCDFLRNCFNRDPSKRPSAKDLQYHFWITTNNNITEDNQKNASIQPTSSIHFDLNQNKNISPELVIQNLDKILNSDSDSDFGSKEPKKTNEIKQPLIQPPKPLLTLGNNPQLKNPDDAFADFSDDDDDDDFNDLPATKNSAKTPLSLPDSNKQAPLLTLTPKSDSKKISPNPSSTQNPQNKQSPRLQPLIKLPGISDQPNPELGDDIFGSDSSSDILGKEEPIKTPSQGNSKPEPLLKLPGSNAKPNKPGAPSALLTLPVNNNPNNAIDIDAFDFSGSDDDFAPAKPANKGNSAPSSGGGAKANKNGGESLQDFMENSDDDLGMDLEMEPGDQNKIPALVIKQEVRGPADFSLFDENAEEEKVLQHRKKVQKLSRKLIKKLKLITTLNSPSDEEQFNQSLDKISEILKSEPTVRSSLVAQQGVLQIIEVIEFSKLKNDKNINTILSIIYDMCKDQSQIKENFCLLGGIPPIMKFLNPDVGIISRHYAVNVLTEICTKSLDNTQMFIACNGLSAICQVLKYDIDQEWESIISAVTTISDYFGTQKATQKADLCRLFMKARLFKPMSEVLLHFATSELFKQNEEAQKTISLLCELFNDFSQADSKVKLALSSPDIMENIVSTMYTTKDGVRRVLTLEDILLLSKTIKFTAMDAETRDNLTDSGVMEMTCEMLKYDFGKGEKKDQTMLNLLIHSNLIMLLNDMCKLSSQVSKKRIGIVADSRLLPHLVEYMDKESELKTMSLSVIMELYNVVKSDKVAMKKLIDDNLIDLYLNNLTHPYWGSKAITAISSLLNEDQEEIEPLITKESALENFRTGIEKVDQDNAQTYISTFSSMVRKSKKFTNALINAELISILINKFWYMHKQNTFSQVPTLLLEFILAMFQSEASNVKHLKSPEMKSIIAGYIGSDNVKQQTNATKILEYFK